MMAPIGPAPKMTTLSPDVTPAKSIPRRQQATGSAKAACAQRIRGRKQISLLRWHPRIFGKSARDVDTERGQVLTQVALVATAKVAGIAHDVRVDGDVIAHPKTVHLRAYSFHYSGILMSGNDREIRGVNTMENVRICAANTPGRDSHE